MGNAVERAIIAVCEDLKKKNNEVSRSDKRDMHIRVVWKLRSARCVCIYTIDINNNIVPPSDTLFPSI